MEIKLAPEIDFYTKNQSLSKGEKQKTKYIKYIGNNHYYWKCYSKNIKLVLYYVYCN